MGSPPPSRKPFVLFIFSFLLFERLNDFRPQNTQKSEPTDYHSLPPLDPLLANFFFLLGVENRCPTSLSDVMMIVLSPFLHGVGNGSGANFVISPPHRPPLLPRRQNKSRTCFRSIHTLSSIDPPPDVFQIFSPRILGLSISMRVSRFSFPILPPLSLVVQTPKLLGCVIKKGAPLGSGSRSPRPCHPTPLQFVRVVFTFVFFFCNVSDGFTCSYPFLFRTNPFPQ